MKAKIDKKEKGFLNVSPLEIFLHETISPLELSKFLDELLLDYGKMYVFASTNCKDDYILPDEINRILDYVKLLSDTLKRCIDEKT
jgi:hypothetical protein